MLADRVTLLVIAVVAVIIARRPGQLCIQHRIFCMGRFRCCIRSSRAFCTVLETHQLAGCSRGNGFRRRYGIRMEISGPSEWFFPGTIYELLPAFLISCVMILVVSLATKAPSKEITDEFELVQKKMAE